MITSILAQFRSIKNSSDLKGIQDNQRLSLASLLVYRSTEEQIRFSDIVNEIAVQASRYSTFYSMRFFVAAFFCRINQPAEQLIRRFQEIQSLVKTHKIATYEGQSAIQVSLLLTLHSASHPDAPMEERVKQVAAAYKSWRGLHPFLTNGSILPILVLNLLAHPDVEGQVARTEAIYQQLLPLGLNRSMKTMQFAWLLNLHRCRVQEVGTRFLQLVHSFHKQRLSNTTAAAQLLSLHVVDPDLVVAEVEKRYRQLLEEKALRFTNRALLIRIATQAYLYEGRPNLSLDQLVEPTTLQEMQRDVSLYGDGMDSLFVISVIAVSDTGGADCGGGDGGSSGDGGGGDGGC